MSLNRLALRLVTVAALSGRTLAGAAVRDSMITPPDDSRVEAGGSTPYIAVYTDDGQANPAGRDLATAEATVGLVIEFGVTARMRFTLPNGETFEEDGPPPTDQALEMSLDVLERQIKMALVDAGNPWGVLWGSLVKTANSVKTTRGALADRGGRFAGRLLEIEAAVLADPPYGAAPTGFWAKLLTAMQADTKLAKHHDMFRGLIVAGAPLPEWRVLVAQLGLSPGEADSMLITPPDGVTADIAIVSVEATPAVPTP